MLVIRTLGPSAAIMEAESEERAAGGWRSGDGRQIATSYPDLHHKQYPTYLHTNPLKNSSSGQKRRKNNTTQKHYTIYRLF